MLTYALSSLCFSASLLCLAATVRIVLELRPRHESKRHKI